MGPPTLVHDYKHVLSLIPTHESWCDTRWHISFQYLLPSTPLHATTTWLNRLFVLTGGILGHSHQSIVHNFLIVLHKKLTIFLRVSVSSINVGGHQHANKRPGSVKNETSLTKIVVITEWSIRRQSTFLLNNVICFVLQSCHWNVYVNLYKICNA